MGVKVTIERRADGYDCWGRTEYEDFYVVTNDKGKVVYNSKYDPTNLIKELTNNKED